MSQLTDYDTRSETFSRIRALIMKIVVSRPGLTISELTQEFLLRYGFAPRIDNRVRELRSLGWVETVKEGDGLLHVYPKKAES